MTPEQARNTIAQQTPIININDKSIMYANWADLQLHYYEGIMGKSYFTKCEDRAMELYAQHRNLDVIQLDSSKCCNDKYWISTSDENTSFHVCYKCGKACDLNYYDLELELLLKQHRIFAQETFTQSTWQSSLEGLKREIKEVEEADKTNWEGWMLEYVDCLKYLLDSMYRAGAHIHDIKRLFKKKLEINRNRNWAKNPDNSYSHIK